MYDDDDLIIDMLEAGARGYLLKNAHKTEIIEAIETVNLGNPYHCQHTSKKLLNLIKESKYNPYTGKAKSIFIDKEIEIPFETNCFDEITNYKLKGFIMHSGGVFGGHYYAYGTRKINDEIKWFCYNDTNVTEVTIEQVTVESKKAYLFLYSKK